MLNLHLTLTNNQVSVRANGKESHQFPLLDLSQSKEEWKDFFDNPRVYGEKLFNALFKDAARTEFDALSKQSERTIVLVLESSELDGVAWEYAYNKVKEEYVVEDCAFVRALPESERPANGRLKASYERVPLLFIPANPLVDLSGEPMPALDVDGEWKVITRHILTSAAPFDLCQLRPATPEDLQTILANFRNGLIVHFSGHGAATKDGAILLFEEKNGAARKYAASEFVRTVKDQAMIVFLSACQSAVAGKTEFSNLARELVEAGVPFALGMQFNLPDKFDDIISQQFYNYLARGYTIPEAALQARRALKNEAKKTGDEFFVGMIALYAAHPEETGKLTWHGSGAQIVPTFRPADVSDLPSPASGLIGRQRELMRIGTRLLDDKKPLTVTLHGAGGIGKTALLWQALLRFAPSFELTLAIGLDPLPSLESVLGWIERFLGLPSPCSNDTKEREAIVRNALTSKRTLLGLDNFETLNYALNEKGSDEEKTAKSLHSFFNSLAANGVTLCVTSRDVTDLGGEYYGEEIRGLSNEDGGRLFQENVKKQNDKIYIDDTRNNTLPVSEVVGGHPLALRLLASAFDDNVGMSLEQFVEELQSFLPKARDKWTEEDRHESLCASFDFTMNNLANTKEGKDLQTALAKLSIFTAFFSSIIAAPVLTNEIFEDEEKYKQAIMYTTTIFHNLWERSLLEHTTIRLSNENTYIYRLHPTIRVFARELLVDTEPLREIYWQSMNDLASLANEEIAKNPFVAQITSYAMPDLILASEIKDDVDAALMQFIVGRLLRQFGLYDEALRLLTKSQDIFTSLNYQREKIVVRHEMAQIFFIRGDLNRAMRLYQEAIEIVGDLDDEKIKSDTFAMMAQIYITRGDLDEAMKLFQQSREIEEKIGDQEGMAATLHEMAYIYVTRGDVIKAMELYQQSLKIFEELGDLQGKATALHQIAGIYKTQGDLDRAVKLYQQSLEIKNGLVDLKGKSATLNQMAGICLTKGDLDEAMQLYQQSFEILEELGDLQGKATTIHQMAGIYVSRTDYDKAMKMYQLSLDIKERIGDLKGKGATFHEMGYIYLKRGDLEEAMKLYQKSLDTAEQLGDFQGKGATLHAKANIYFIRGNFDEAINLYEQSLEIKEQMNDLFGKVSTLYMLGQVFWKKGEYEKGMRWVLAGYFALTERQADPQTQQEIKETIQTMKNQLPKEEFTSYWQNATSQPIPVWLNNKA